MRRVRERIHLWLPYFAIAAATALSLLLEGTEPLAQTGHWYQWLTALMLVVLGAAAFANTRWPLILRVLAIFGGPFLAVDEVLELHDCMKLVFAEDFAGWPIRDPVMLLYGVVGALCFLAGIRRVVWSRAAIFHLAVAVLAVFFALGHDVFGWFKPALDRAGEEICELTAVTAMAAWSFGQVAHQRTFTRTSVARAAALLAFCTALAFAFGVPYSLGRAEICPEMFGEEE
jgi:hypothetical protein